MTLPHQNLLSRLLLDRILCHRGCRKLSFNRNCALRTTEQSSPQRSHWLKKDGSCSPSKKSVLCSHNLIQFTTTCSLTTESVGRAALKPSEITESEYEICAEETLDSLAEFFEDLPENIPCNDDYDCAFGSGVLTIHFGSVEGSYVINKQTPNKQIWLSSPLSGPKRYDYFLGQWIYLRDGKGLHRLLEEEISDLLGHKIEMKRCKFYSWGTSDKK